MSYLKRLRPRRPPQRAPIAGSGQAPNPAGGSAWAVDGPRAVAGIVRVSEADPADPGTLAVGFDTATPQLISDFARGAL